MYDWVGIAEVLGDGLIFPRDLADLGVTRSWLERALNEKVLYRVRRGVYARPPADTREGLAERHRNLVRALDVATESDRVVSHLSAAAMHGLPIIGVWPPRVELLMLYECGGRSGADFAGHRVREPPEFVTLQGVRVTTLERTLVDVSATSTLLVATAMLDSALNQRLTTADLVSEELERLAPRYGRHRAETAIAFADARAASVGESLSRVRMHQLNFAAPELQVHVSTHLGEHDVDFGWESAALFGEFDGFGKYAREELLKGETPAQAVVREKAREDAIRGKTRRAFVRWGWNDAFSPRRFERVLREGGVPTRRGRR